MTVIKKLPLVAAALLLAAATAPTHADAADKPKKIDYSKTDWRPGTTPIPNELLANFPCHSEELACSKIPAPEVETVSFTGPLQGDPEMGRKIATNLRWGNCLACHSLPGGVAGGSVGPDLSDYGARNMPLDYTYQRIWDTRVFNPDAHMPVYGPNEALTPEEIQHVIAYLHTGK
ncbi:sulfur oxidation c-type cytochrome SoxX [Novispirillum sp. DQ9]|uniref:sulfur oxidation c-type cytochrome SoxX n=1 Tax=Novispirillum sp. DQ9 TaxID=3398612 RepID=UPI003C79F122